MITTIADSISLRIFDNSKILTGVGNELHVHTKDTNQVCPIRLATKIHGIVKAGDKKVLIYGGRNFAILQWRNGEAELINKGSCHYWISNVKFFAENEFVLLGASCVAARVVSDEKGGKCDVIESSGCSDKCLLYCSHLIGNTWEELTVFGGNAFGELIIWQPNGLESPILQRHQMHNGVIFSIDYDETTQTLITTSDDRSIRFWHLQMENGNWRKAQLKPMASGYGHTARVFKGKLLKYENRLYAITVGEDSHFCVWQTNGELLYKRRQHFGAIIWNFEFHLTTLYTVSSTGNLMAYDLKHVLDSSLRDNESNTVAITYDQGDPGEYVAKIKYVSGNLLIGITSKNKLVFAYDEGKAFAWQRLTLDESSNYKATVLETYNNMIVVCGYKRYTLYSYTSNQIEKVKEVQILNGIIRSFQFLDEHTYIVSDDQGNCVLQRHSKDYAVELPKSKELWLTAALLIDSELLLLSNRQGNLLLYKHEADKFCLKDVLKHPHGFLGATQLKLIEHNEAEAFVKSSGHDGALRTLRICKSSGLLAICSREVIPIAWVEFQASHNGEELFLGFNDNHFVAWSRDRDFLMQTPCGGGHRCWDYHLDGEGLLKLVFIRNKQVVREARQLLLPAAATATTTTCEIRMPLRNKWHVKPCNVMALIKGCDTEHDNVLISAGDDNLIKISTHNQRTRAVVQKAEIHSHISNVRALKVLNADENAWLIFSGGGRAQLCVTLFNDRTFRFTEMLNYTLNDAKNSKNGQGKSLQGYRFNPETRIMACDVLRLANDEGFLIFLGCSDGFLRKLHLSKDYVVETQEELFYGRCVLQVRLIGDQYVLTGATDGLLRLYDLNLYELMAERRLEHHSSGVNALDVLLDDNGNQLHILTGGDDEIVTYSQLDLSKRSVVRTKSLPALHTAQVTGARLLWKDSALYSLTSGVDQIVIKYNLTDDCVESEFVSCVADVKGLCVDDKHWCHVYGCGLQIFEFTS